MENQNQECCPKFETAKWDNKTFSWNKKPFIKESLPTFFHMPFPPAIGKRMKKMYDLVDKAQANFSDLSDALVLFHDPSAFKSEIFYSVTHEVPGANNVGLSGEFIAGVFDGPFNSVPKHIKEMEKRLANKDQKARDYYIHYAYCPKCAKKFGHNYMILFAEM
ncbi:hydrolase [Bacteroidota bacterium]